MSSCTTNNFLFHLFLLFTSTPLLLATNPPDKQYLATSPPHSFHSSNLYSNSKQHIGPSVVEELSVDPSLWEWNGPPQRSPAWAVILYAPWCGHCQHFVKTWEEYATNAIGAECNAGNGGQFQMRVGAVNCVAHENICNTYQVKTYPTVILFWHEQGSTKTKPSILRHAELKKRGPTEIVAETMQLLKCQTYRRPTETGATMATTDGHNQRDQKNNLRGEGTLHSSKEGDTTRSSAAQGGAIDAFVLSNRIEDAMRAVKFGLLQIGASRTSLTESEHEAVLQWTNAVLLTSRTVFPASFTNNLDLLLLLLQEKTTTLSSHAFHQALITSKILKEEETMVVLSTTGWKSCRDASITSSVAPHANVRATHRRGFTCGLWTLFHLMVSNIPTHAHIGQHPHPQDTLAPSPTTKTVLGIVQFIDSFFQCKECRDHFMKEYGTRAYLDQYQATESNKGAVEWLWRAHNGVNARLRTLEPLDSKWMLPFPQCHQCPLCCEGVGTGSTPTDEGTTVLFIRNLYCVDRSQHDFTCVPNSQGDWSTVSFESNNNGMKFYQTTVGFWIYTILMVVCLFGCSKYARKNYYKKN